MFVICKTNDAFEDSLTSGKSYRIRELRNASVLIENDRGTPSWFGLSRFQLHSPKLEALRGELSSAS